MKGNIVISNKELLDKQIQMQKEMQENGLNIVSCGNCGALNIHRVNKEDNTIKCVSCVSDMEKSDCPDIFF